MTFVGSFVACVLLSLGPSAPAQESPSAADALRQRIEAALEGLGEPHDGEEASVARRTLEQGSAELDRAQQIRERSAASRAWAAEVPAAVQALRAELALPVTPAAIAVPEGAEVRELETLLRNAEAGLDAARNEHEELVAEADRRSGRRQRLPEEIAEAALALRRAEREVGALPPGEPDAPARLLEEAQVEAARADVERLREEQAALEARHELLPLRRDAAQRRVALATEVLAQWDRLVAAARQAEAESVARSANERRDKVLRGFPELADLASRNEALAVMRAGQDGLPARITGERETVRELEHRVKELEQRSRTANRRMRIAGLSEGTAAILRRDYEWLPSATSLEQLVRAAAEELADAELQLLALQEERDELSAQLGLTSGTADDYALAAGQLRAEREGLIEDVLRDLDQLVRELYRRVELLASMQGTANAYRERIEERILWIRSRPLNPFPDLWGLPTTGVELAQALGDVSWGSSLRASARARGLGVALLVLVAAIGFAAQRLLKRRRAELTERVRSFRSDAFVLTLRALALTVALALPGPLLLGALGRLFSGAPDELVAALGSAFGELASVWFVLRFVSQVAQPNGLGEVHFRWPESIRAIRVEVRWFLPWVLVTGSAALALERHSRTEWSDSIGRTGFVLAMGGLALFLSRIVRPSREVFAASLQEKRGLVARTQRLWSAIAVGFPLLLGALALTGYGYTAFEFEQRWRATLGLAIALGLAHSLLLRWLFVTRRRLAIEQARQRARARAQSDAEALSAGGTPVSESGAGKFDEDAVDIPAIDVQTRQMFRSGITLTAVLGVYFLWASALPALRGFESVQLWPELRIEREADRDPDLTDPGHDSALMEAPSASYDAAPLNPLSGGALSMPRDTAAVAEDAVSSAGGSTAFVLTLADLCLATIFLFLTYVASRNVPGLLEITLLNRLPLDAGGRYAVTTILRYLILIAGSSATFGAVGLGWDKIQWLAAAMTFGLAFGLQEIFANFVSGLIILLERPVRVGDIVTVGGVEGRVTRLRMRATTIQDWDRRELLIPNKEFITGSVINWTLSDPVTRIVISVGVAYGSDTRRARELLLEAARDTGLVLEDPAPTAIFRRFGESTLDFDLRVFMADRDLWPQIVDGVHAKIDAKFRAAGIEIAFPQRDLHLRTAEGLERALAQSREPDLSPGPDPSQVPGPSPSDSR